MCPKSIFKMLPFLYLVNIIVAAPINLKEDNLHNESVQTHVTDETYIINTEEYIDAANTKRDRMLEDYADSKKQTTFQSLYSSYFDLADKEDEDNMQADAPTDILLNVDGNSFKHLLHSSNKTQLNLTNLLINSTIYQNENNSNRYDDIHRDRQKSKNDWLDHLKTQILYKTGRHNDTGTFSHELLEKIRLSLNETGGLNLSSKQIPNVAGSDTENGEYIEKIRSYYPSCDVPRNTDEEAWKDVNTMNLFFTIDYNNVVGNGASSTNNQQGQEETVNIASATLRLYKIPQEGNSTVIENCPKSDNPLFITEDDRQIRVSIYWYLRSLKKHKAIKRRLVDSRMVPLMDRHTNTQYVEFNIRQATKSWVKGRNLGLAVVVEDVDGIILPTEKYFKGIGCDTVGNVSTPKPIPTMVIDALRRSGGFKGAAHGFNANTNSYNTFMPIIDICTIELPSHMHIGNSTIVCKYLKQDKSLIIGDAKYETKIDSTNSPRRHRHHHGMDVRSKIISKKLVLPNLQVHSLNSNNTLR